MRFYGVHIDDTKKEYICNNCRTTVKRLKYVYETECKYICRCMACGQYVSVLKDVDANEKKGRGKAKN